MNTFMYQHPFTADHLKIVQERLGYMILGPQGAGTLACGDEGMSG
jgi:phosphopantothenoylcysteine decarboxylase